MLEIVAGIFIGYLWVRGSRYHACPKCRKSVRVNKPVLGSLHICAEEK